MTHKKLLFFALVAAVVGMYAKIIPTPGFVASLNIPGFQAKPADSGVTGGGFVSGGVVSGGHAGGDIIATGAVTFSSSLDGPKNGWGCGCGDDKCHTGYQYTSMNRAIEAMRRKCGGKCSPNCQAKYDRAPSGAGGGNEGTVTAEGPTAPAAPGATAPRPADTQTH